MGARASLAKAITVVMNAPLLAVLTFVYVFYAESPLPIPLLCASILFSGALPVGIIYYLRRSGLVADMMVDAREERTKPFLGAAASYLLGVVAMAAMEAPTKMLYLMACYLVNSVVMMIISLRYKISIHASGLAGPATFLIHQYGVSLWPFMVPAVVVSWARLELRMHTAGQVAWGFLVTIALTLAQLELYPALIHLL